MTTLLFRSPQTRIWFITNIDIYIYICVFTAITKIRWAEQVMRDLAYRI